MCLSGSQLPVSRRAGLTLFRQGRHLVLQWADALVEHRDPVLDRFKQGTGVAEGFTPGVDAEDFVELVAPGCRALLHERAEKFVLKRPDHQFKLLGERTATFESEQLFQPGLGLLAVFVLFDLEGPADFLVQ